MNDSGRISKQRESRANALGYDPTYRPSLSARRALARMYRGVEYTPDQVAVFSQSIDPQEILRQLRVRGYIRVIPLSSTERRYRLTELGNDFAAQLRASGEYPEPPPGSAPAFAMAAEPPHKRARKERTDWQKFELGYGPDAYLTNPQKALLRAVVYGLNCKPRKHTAAVLIRCGLAEWVDGVFVATIAGIDAAKKLSEKS